MLHSPGEKVWFKALLFPAWVCAWWMSWAELCFLCLPPPVPSCGTVWAPALVWGGCCVPWQPCLGGTAELSQRLDIRGLTHTVLGSLGPCSSLELLLLPKKKILPSCIFSNFPPQGFQSDFSICGSCSRCARPQLSARAVAGDAGEGDELPRAPSTLLACTRVCSLGLSGLAAVKWC